MIFNFCDSWLWWSAQFFRTTPFSTVTSWEFHWLKYEGYIPIFGLMCLWLQARYHRNDRVCAWIDHSSCSSWEAWVSSMKAQAYETLKRQREEETLGIHGNEPRSNREDRAELRYSSRPPLISFMTTKNWRRICISMQNFSLGLDDVPACSCSPLRIHYYFLTCQYDSASRTTLEGVSLYQISLFKIQ